MIQFSVDSIQIGNRPPSPRTAALQALNPTHIERLHAYLCTTSVGYPYFRSFKQYGTYFSVKYLKKTSFGSCPRLYKEFNREIRTLFDLVA